MVVSGRLDMDEWFQAAVELDQENRELRRWLTGLLFYLASNAELLDVARRGITARWPERDGQPHG